MKRSNKKMRSDLLRSASDWLMPILIKKGIELIPRGTKVDDFLKNWKEHWDKIAFVASTVLLQVTDAPEEVDDILSKMSAEVARAIKRRYDDEEDNVFPGLSKPKKTTEITSLFEGMLSMNKEELLKITMLLSSVSEKQKKSFFMLSYPNKREAKASLRTILSLSIDEFKDWIEMISPTNPPQQESAIEQELKKSFDEFKTDSASFLQQDTWLVKLAKSRGLM